MKAPPPPPPPFPLHTLTLAPQFLPVSATYCVCHVLCMSRAVYVTCYAWHVLYMSCNVSVTCCICHVIYLSRVAYVVMYIHVIYLSHAIFRKMYLSRALHFTCCICHVLYLSRAVYVSCCICTFIFFCFGAVPLLINMYYRCSSSPLPMMSSNIFVAHYIVFYLSLV